MIIPLKYQCRNCGNEDWIKIQQEDSHFNYDCRCGYRGSVYLGQTYNISEKLLERSWYEYENNQDYPLSIILAAMAFESQISQFYVRTQEILELKDGNEVSREDFESWEEELRRMNGVANKIQKISEILVPGGLESYLEDNDELRTALEEGFPSLDIDNLPVSLQKELFWPRNEVLHYGKSNNTAENALKCINIAAVSMRLFNDMEKAWSDRIISE